MADKKTKDTEIEVQARKNIDTRLGEKRKKLIIKEHNIKAAHKIAPREKKDEGIINELVGMSFPKTKKQKLWSTKREVSKKIEGIEEARDKFDSDEWDIKRTGDYDKLLKTGAYRDKKGGQVLEMTHGGLIKGFPKLTKKGWK